ncbi:MAG TPA: hypothetical protein VM890_14370 [Longimicrobium sp.]|jgi:hypothetical protein|nr:hypothetical protein [Longimicrobium sp.]
MLPLVRVPRRGNGGNAGHQIDVDEQRLDEGREIGIRREIEANPVGVAAGRVRTAATTPYRGAADAGGDGLRVAGLSLRPRRWPSYEFHVTP